ncbi:MAG: ATP synthase F1 subunit gamma [Candidatus Nomurabacteria bacterium]|nr:ATP synthase F1 subunit gamma [Candidatus Nomurabacteria bacterium]
MASTKEIKNRIKSIKNTKKITKAMELVAASKMRRAVATTLASRSYAGYSWELLTSLSGKLDEVKNVFFESPKEGKTLIVLITSNGSLCGGYNAQAIKKAMQILKAPLLNKERGGGEVLVDFISIGKKGDHAMRKIGQNIIAAFTDLPVNISIQNVNPISALILNEYKKGTYKEVFVVYTDFVSALTQKPNVRKLLPISRQEMKDMIDGLVPPLLNKEGNEGRFLNSSEPHPDPLLVKERGNAVPYLIEGDANKLIDMLAEKLIRMQIYQMLLESGASEQSARMVAMKNASEAAGEMIDNLTLVFNKARQAGITQEISEISAGMASVS